MTADLRDKTAIVTGAAQGLGQSIGIALYNSGANVVFADVNVDGCEKVLAALESTAGRAIAVGLDVRDEEAFRATFGAAEDRWGYVDILVNNAAQTANTPIWEISQEEWDDVLAVNLRGVFFGCRMAGEHMRDRGGRIVNLASIAGQWGRSLTGAHYVASKAGIIGLTRVFAQTLAGLQITVNAVSPAVIDGPQVQAMPTERIAQYVDQMVPVGRVGRPEEVADLVVFLVSESAAFLTGATIDINGGALMR